MTERNLKDDLKIDPLRINDAIIEQAGLFAYYAEQLAQAERTLKHKRLEVEVFEAALDRQIRDNALSRKEKITEAAIEARMRGNEHWVNRKRELIELESQVDQLKAIVEGLRQKKDMLVTLGANVRAEMTSGIRINAPGPAGETPKPEDLPPSVIPMRIS